MARLKSELCEIGYHLQCPYNLFLGFCECMCHLGDNEGQLGYNEGQFIHDEAEEERIEDEG